MQTTSRTLLLVAIMSSGLLAACGDNDGRDFASVRIVHAAPGAPAVDIYADGVTLVTGLAYGEASPYLAVDAGDYNLVVRAAGSDTIVLETDLIQFSNGDRITAVAAGDVVSTDPANSFRVIPLYDDFGSSDNAEARVRIVHASPDAPTVDIDFDDDGVIDIPDLMRFDDTGKNGVKLPADASLQIGIVAAQADARVTAFTTPALPSRSELYVIATGFVSVLPRDPRGFSLLVVGPEGIVSLTRQNPTVYALHASPDAPAVDIRAAVSGPNLFADLAFGELIPAQVPPGDYALGFFPAGDPSTTPVTTASLSGLAAGERYLAVVTGMLTPIGGEQPFQLLPYQDAFVVDANPRIRSIHVSPDAPAVDISTATGSTITTPILIRDLTFGEATSPEGLAVASAPSIRIGVAPTSSLTALATFNLNTTGTPRQFVLAAGALTPAADEQSFRLFVVNTAVSPWTIQTVLPN